MDIEILELIEKLDKNDCCPLIVNERLVSDESWDNLDVFESVSYPFGYLKIGYSFSFNYLIIEFASLEEIETKILSIKDRNSKSGFCSFIGLSIIHYVNRALEEVTKANPTEFYFQKERLLNWETKVSERIHRVKLNHLFVCSY